MTPLPPHDGEPFLAGLEQSQRDGDFGHVDANVGRVQALPPVAGEGEGDRPGSFIHMR